MSCDRTTAARGNLKVNQMGVGDGIWIKMFCFFESYQNEQNYKGLEDQLGFEGFRFGSQD